jgi:hypothetical protein
VLARWQERGFERLVANKRSLVDQPYEDILAHFRTREAVAVKEMKLERYWDPSPFPGEVSEDQRPGGSEPRFATTPWPVYSAAWRHAVPQRPGETAFARIIDNTRDSWQMVRMLTAEEARQVHQNNEPYGLATRLPDGRLLLLWRSGAMGRYEVRIENDGSAAMAQFDDAVNAPGELCLSHIRVVEERSHSPWDMHVDRREHEKQTFLFDLGPAHVVSLRESELARYELTEPPFGDSGPLVDFVVAVMNEEGVGHLVPAGNAPL